MILVVEDNEQTTMNNALNPDEHEDDDNTSETQLASVYIDRLSRSLPQNIPGNGVSERRNALHIKCQEELPPRPSSIHSADGSIGKQSHGIKKKLRDLFHRKDKSSTRHMDQFSTSHDGGDVFSTSFETDFDEVEVDDGLDHRISGGNSRSSTPDKSDGHSVNFDVADDFVIRSDSMSSTSTTGSQTPRRKAHHHLTAKLMHKLHDKALEVLSRLGVASEETLESSVITERVTEAGIKEETDRAREIIEAFTERGHVTASTEPEEMDLVGITHILPAYETHEMPDFENDFVGVYHEIPLHTAEIQCSAETKFNPFAAMFGKKNNHLDSGTMAEIPAFTKRRGTYSRVGDIHGNDVTAGNVDPILVEPVDFRRPSLTNDVADLPLGKLNTLGDNPYRFLSNRRDR